MTTEHILSLSNGKDSLACLGAIEQLEWPLDRPFRWDDTRNVQLNMFSEVTDIDLRKPV